MPKLPGMTLAVPVIAPLLVLKDRPDGRLPEVI